MAKILVIGASGFVGRHLAKGLLAEGYEVRCTARKTERVQDLAALGCEIVQGDVLDLTAMQRALVGMQAVYITIHTLNQQPASTAGQTFVDIERLGLENIVTACRENGVRRLIFVTSLGIDQNSPSAWVRGRWQEEKTLLNSGLNVTILRPGQIVGVGGLGFNMMVANAKRAVAITMAPGENKMQNIAVDDLVYYLIGVLNDPRAYGQAYDVGADDILSNDQMMDVAADVLGRKHPYKLHIPPSLLGAIAPLIERLAKAPKGAIKGLTDGMYTDLIGDPMPIRAILPRPLLSYRQAVERALKSSTATSV